jgi:tetratricopeptide (TPR) repeat protein
MSARDPVHLEGERRLVTVLFADVVGSTALAERMDPEDWTALINRVFEVMSQAVTRYEGTVGQFIGDEILAYFGAPASHALGNDRYRGLALALLADAAYLSSNFQEAIEHLEEALPLLDAREEFAHAAVSGGLLAISYAVMGEFEKAAVMGRRALEWGRVSGDPNALLDAQLFMGRVEAERGNLVRAGDLYRQSIALAEETGNTLCATVGNLWLGANHLRMGRPELGVPAIERSAELAQFCNMSPLRGVGKAWLGAVYYERGDSEKTEEAWDAGLRAAEALGDRLTGAEIRSGGSGAARWPGATTNGRPRRSTSRRASPRSRPWARAPTSPGPFKTTVSPSGGGVRPSRAKRRCAGRPRSLEPASSALGNHGREHRGRASSVPERLTCDGRGRRTAPRPSRQPPARPSQIGARPRCAPSPPAC